ncbi:MAG TPA: DUF456 domain-containing protein [Candidatus Absconditabacterales bacterium]|nr:DUF456 domain-containing protein [Candidatus Absconditabacterales bacterium]
MDILRITLSIVVLILGFIGIFLPVLPGPPLAYLSLIFIQIANKPFSTQFLIIMAVVCIFLMIMDYAIPIIGTKKMGGTKRGVNGSTIGLVLGVVILPIMGVVIGPFGLIGLLGGPFLGAYVGEIVYQKYKKQKLDNKKALKSAFGSFLGFISGVLIKIIYTILVAIYLFPKIFGLIKGML